MRDKLTKIIFESKDSFNIFPVYHGGTWDGIRPIKVNGRGALGVGAYFTPVLSSAERYAKESGGKVVETAISVHNPLKIESGNGSHPMIEALVQLGVSRNKAEIVVEKQEEKYGYMGSQVKSLALKSGFDGIFQYFNKKLYEIVIWSPFQVRYLTADK